MNVIATDDSTNWEISVTYARDPSAVVVRYSVEFDRVEVELIRLVNGKVPNVPIFVHAETPINRALLDDLLILKAPSEADELKTLSGLSKASVERSLRFHAQAVRRYASEFLEGDTEVFADFDRLIKARAARNPQTLKISFPEGTSREEVDRGVARARLMDPEVPVEVHFYCKPVAIKRASRWPWKKPPDASES